jgi:hypothetical protein
LNSDSKKRDNKKKEKEEGKSKRDSDNSEEDQSSDNADEIVLRHRSKLFKNSEKLSANDTQEKLKSTKKGSGKKHKKLKTLKNELKGEAAELKVELKNLLSKRKQAPNDLLSECLDIAKVGSRGPHARKPRVTPAVNNYHR